MGVICALILFASARPALGMAPLMGSFVPVGRPQSSQEVRMLVESAARKFPMMPPAARENMYEGREGKGLARRPMARMPKMMNYRYGCQQTYN